jgi:aminopeptidase-like protein
LSQKKLLLLLKKLFPINRSITGEGFLESLKILNKTSKIIKIKSISSGKKVYDWEIPKVWSIKDAFISHAKKKLIDFKINNLHVLGYSSPVKTKLYFKDLKNKLIVNKKIDRDAIPYATSYYKKNWGFCVSRKQYLKLSNIKTKFDIMINSNFKNGKLKWGEATIKGKSKKTIILSTYLCHPSMANNELSGPVVCNELINFLKKRKNNYSYKIIFLPETIGSISFISQNFEELKKNVLCGFVISCVGDKGQFSKINSRYNNNFADKILNQTFNKYHIKFRKFSYLERGSDERQYCSPLVDLPFCTLTRTKFENYKEYHTSKDDLNFINPKNLFKTINFLKKLIIEIENSILPVNSIKCEPMLSKRKLYPKTKTSANYQEKYFSKKLLDFLSYSDGSNNLSNISQLINTSKAETTKLFETLKKNKLINI